MFKHTLPFMQILFSRSSSVILFSETSSSWRSSTISSFWTKCTLQQKPSLWSSDRNKKWKRVEITNNKYKADLHDWTFVQNAEHLPAGTKPTVSMGLQTLPIISCHHSFLFSSFSRLKVFFSQNVLSVFWSVQFSSSFYITVHHKSAQNESIETYFSRHQQLSGLQLRPFLLSGLRWWRAEGVTDLQVRYGCHSGGWTRHTRVPLFKVRRVQLRKTDSCQQK